MVRQASKACYFGIPGSFTHTAATMYFDGKATLSGTETFRDVFARVKSGEFEWGIVPIENTLAGSIYENYDLLDAYQVYIVGEISCRVEHNLLVSAADNPSTRKLKDIKTVYSHQKALEQCSLFLDAHPWIKRVPYADTATAARYVSQQADPTIAAIASSNNVAIYGLHNLRSNVENNAYNYTRFLVISSDQHGRPESVNKCSVVVHLQHVTGSLSHALASLTDQGCNLTKIESRPLPNKPFEYVFYLDVLFDGGPQAVDAIIATLKEHVSELKVLGIYRDERTAKLS